MVLSAPKILILSLLLSVSVSVQSAAPFPPEALPGVPVGGSLPSYYEASGIVWHSGMQLFYLVSDNGIVSSMTESGTNLRHWTVSGDLEAVTVAFSQSDFIYLGCEHPDSILEFNIVTGEVTRVFELTYWMRGPNDSGLEALTFVPDATDPEGGLFYAGLQATGEIFVFRLPILTSSTRTNVTHIRTIGAVNGVSDISGLHYTPSQDVLYAVYDGASLLRAMRPDGGVIGEWELPGTDQEGVTLKGGELYICEDYGGSGGGNVFRYAPFFVLPQADLNADGKVDFQDFGLMAEYWSSGLYREAADLNGDGFLDAADIALFAEFWLRGI